MNPLAQFVIFVMYWITVYSVLLAWHYYKKLNKPAKKRRKR